jgi:hypothetical protein
MKTSKTHFVLLLGGLLLMSALCACLWMLYLVTTAGQTLASHVETIANNEAKEKAYADLAAVVESTRVQREQLSSFILTENTTGDFLTVIESLGSSQGVSLTTTSLKVTKQKTGPDTLQVEFEVAGTEGAVKKMIGVFETLPYLSTVSTLSIKTPVGKETSATIGLAMTLFSYD